MGSLVELARRLRSKIEEMAQGLTDSEALEYKELIPPWFSGVSYRFKEDGTPFKVRREDAVYKLRQEHTSQKGWEPENTPALWARIDVEHSGTAADPIPYSVGMALEGGKYYIQNGVTYICTRSTGAPVYHDLVHLVGLYVEVANE